VGVGVGGRGRAATRAAVSAEWAGGGLSCMWAEGEAVSTGHQEMNIYSMLLSGCPEGRTGLARKERIPWHHQ
jgi:hypothetical protein